MKDYKRILQGVVNIINITKKSDIGFANICTYIGENCPELAESEDERIRKGLLYVIEHHPTLPTEETEEYIAWLEAQGEHAKFLDSIQVGDKVTRNKDGVLVNLSQLNRVAKKNEKQGEQNPAWSEEDEKIANFIWDSIDKSVLANYGFDEDKTFEWLSHIKNRVLPHSKPNEWSEEDEYCIHQLIVFCENCMVKDDGAKRCAHWLKSLKDRYTWKPSEEQMEALSYEVDAWDEDSANGQNLRSLYEQLKKLKE